MTKKPETELRKLRKSYGIDVKELCEELGMSKGLYSMHESGMRRYKDEKYEIFYHDVAHALDRIVKRRQEESQNQEIEFRNEGLTIQDEKLHQLMQDEDYEDDDEEELIYPPITENIFKKALNMVSEGKNLIQIAVALNVCEIELEKRLAKINTNHNNYNVNHILFDC